MSPLGTFFCNAKFGRYRGMADIDPAAPIQHPTLQAKHAIRRPPERRFESIQTSVHRRKNSDFQKSS
jgi:hypothetical protein